jgi:hypothetical protein
VGILYATSDTTSALASVSIAPLVGSPTTTNPLLTNIPTNAGVPSTWVFSIPPMANAIVPNQLDISFPTTSTQSVYI